MPDKKWIWLWAVIIILFSASGCAPRSVTSNTVTSPTSTSVSSTNLSDPSEVLSKVLRVISNVQTYKLDINLKEDYEVYSVPNGTESSDTAYTWKINKSVDTANKGFETSIDIEGSETPFKWELRLIDGWESVNSSSPVVYQNGAPLTFWDKNQAGDQLDQLWNDENQISQLQRLLESATNASIVGNDTVNGVDCTILNVIPSATAAASWVLSQQQFEGPSFYWWKTGPERSQEIYDQAYQSGTINLWVTKDNYQIVKTTIDALFDVKPGNAKKSDTGLEILPGDESSIDVGFAKIITHFQDEMQFSAYNRPVSIGAPATNDELLKP
jgi:hypothetical protein